MTVLQWTEGALVSADASVRCCREWGILGLPVAAAACRLPRCCTHATHEHTPSRAHAGPADQQEGWGGDGEGSGRRTQQADGEAGAEGSACHLSHVPLWAGLPRPRCMQLLRLRAGAVGPAAGCANLTLAAGICGIANRREAILAPRAALNPSWSPQVAAAALLQQQMNSASLLPPAQLHPRLSLPSTSGCSRRAPAAADGQWGRR